MSGNLINRRRFITNSAVGIGGLMASTLPIFADQGILTKDKTVRIGIVGTGRRGLGLINTIGGISGLEVVACCDLIPENLAAAVAKAGSKAKGYKDYEKLLTDKNVDAVIVATPLYLHYPMSVAALEMNKHVFVEKSMAFKIHEALDLVKRMKSSKQVLQVGFQYRNFALYHKVKEVLQQGAIGDYSVECQYNRVSDWRREVSDPQLERIINWRLYSDMCGGLLSELCAHQIDIVGYLVDSHATKAVGIGGIDFFKDGRETHDHVRTVYEYGNGVKATYTSTLVNDSNPFLIKILGSKGVIEIGRRTAYIHSASVKQTVGIVDGVTGATITSATPEGKVEIPYLAPGTKYAEPTVAALQDFYNCVVNGKTPLSNVETGRDTAIAICMGLDAMETGNAQYWKPEYSI